MKCKIVNRGGTGFIEIDGTLYPPLAFRSFRPTPANISQFYDCGVRLFQMICTGKYNAQQSKYSLFGEQWIGENEYDFSTFDKQMEMFLSFAPNGKFCVMIQLDTRDWYCEKHGCPDSFRNFGIMAFNDEWVEKAKKYLTSFIKYAEEKWGDKIFCYSFSCGYATEWFTQDKGAFDSLKEEKFKEHMGDGSLKIPSEEELNKKTEEFLHGKNSIIPQYYKFTAKKCADLICEFAATAKKAMNGDKLVGLFYGYLMLGSSTSARWGTFCYEKVWKCKDIDMLFSPAAYGEFRSAENPAAYQNAVDSLSLGGKLYMHEIDHRTHLAKYPIDCGAILNDCYDTEYESIMALRRELAQALQKGAAMWWFDFYGGYFANANYSTEIKKSVEIYNKIAEIPRSSVAEIAVFYDPNSEAVLNDNLNLKEDFVNHNILEIAKSGVPYDVYNYRDAAAVDLDRYKLLIFLNNFISDSDTEKKIIASAAYKLRIHAPGYAANHEIKDVEKIVGMTLAIENQFSNIVCDNEKFAFSDEVYPLFKIDEDVEVLGTFEKSGNTGIGIKGKNIYSAMGNIPCSVFQKIMKKADVHIYTENGTGIYGDSRFFCYQNPFSENCEIFLKEDAKFIELFENKKYKSKNSKLNYTAKPGETKLFLKL